MGDALTRLNDWRKQQCFTVESMADRLDMARPYLSDILRGARPITPSFRGKFADAFGYDTAEAVFANGDTPEVTA